MEYRQARREIIVVGVDGTPQSEEALRFAVVEAEHTGDQVDVLTAWSLQPSPVDARNLLGGAPSLTELEAAARESQEYLIERVLADHPAVSLTRRVGRGDAGVLLVRASRHARLLVVGSRGLGPIRAAFVGSVGRYCAQHAQCPVAIVPSGAPMATVAEGLARTRRE